MVRTPRIAVRPPPKLPVLWIVDSEQWPRACLRAELIERGYDTCGFVTLDDALSALAARVSPCPDAFILELRDQTVTRQTLRAIQDLGIPTILLGGAVELSDPLIQEWKWTRVLRRPFSLGTIADIVEQLCNAGRGGKTGT